MGDNKGRPSVRAVGHGAFAFVERALLGVPSFRRAPFLVRSGSVVEQASLALSGYV